MKRFTSIATLAAVSLFLIPVSGQWVQNVIGENLTRSAVVAAGDMDGASIPDVIANQWLANGGIYWYDNHITEYVEIPDTAFLYALIEEGVDTNGDSLISYEEAEKMQALSLDCRGGYGCTESNRNNIISLEGIEAFMNIETLCCSCGRLERLDLTGNPKLRALSCGENEIESLDISQNTLLEELNCDDNQLTQLDVSKNSALEVLDCGGNQIASLDVSKNTSLTSLDCSSNQLTNLDISNNINLTALAFHDNELTSVDVSNNPGLEELGCGDNLLTELDLSNNPSLIELNCYGNQLSSLDLTNNTLEVLSCGYNPLTSLDVSNFTALRGLDCRGVDLFTLDVSKNTALEYLICTDCSLSTLDVSNNVALKSLSCCRNELTTLDISNNIEIFDLLIQGMPYLHEVCVWTIPFPPEGIGVASGGSPNVYFTTECVYNNDSIVFIPDTAFLHALIKEGVDTNGDSLISYGEAEAVNYLDVSGSYNKRGNISDMTGIEVFVNLDTLYCFSNNLNNLDLSNNLALIKLACDDNQLSSLDLSNNTALTNLDCNYNLLKSLDLSNNAALEILECDHNQLTSLDVSNTTLLEILFCNDNQLASLDVTGCTALRGLVCSDNRLTNLDVSTNINLEGYLGRGPHYGLVCSNNQLTSLDISSNIKLRMIDLSDMPSLGEVCVWESFAADTADSERYMEISITGSTGLCFQTDCNDVCNDEITLSVSVDTIYQPVNIEATSSADGMIYLVPLDTDMDIEVIRGACMDSVEAVMNTPVNIPLMGLVNGIYWLLARDNSENISEPRAIAIMGVGVEQRDSENLRIYPNPTYSMLTVETNTSKRISIEITSLNGRLILSREMEGFTHQVDLSSLQRGIYFITVRSKDFLTTRKIIKM